MDLLRNKSETFSKFKEFKALTEKQSGKSIKCSGQMVEVNMIHMSFQIFVSSMASRDSSPPDTLHSRMELLNGRTGPS